MTDDEKDASKEQDSKHESADAELTDAQLDDISGGINPQPLPPGRSRN